MVSKKIPRIRKTNYAAFIPQVAILLLLILIFDQLEIPHHILMSVAIYLLLSFYLKILIPKWHRKGIFYLKKGELAAAVIAFQKSYDFFVKNRWLDRYRAFTLLSTSALSYTEMALINIIYCYNQLNDNKKANEYHKLLKKSFPQNPYV